MQCVGQKNLNYLKLMWKGDSGSRIQSFSQWLMSWLVEAGSRTNQNCFPQVCLMGLDFGPLWGKCNMKFIEGLSWAHNVQLISLILFRNVSVCLQFRLDPNLNVKRVRYVLIWSVGFKLKRSSFRALTAEARGQGFDLWESYVARCSTANWTAYSLSFGALLISFWGKLVDFQMPSTVS